MKLTAVPFIWPSDAVPSLGSYGGQRWWLSIRELAPNQTDLYATKDGHDWIQLTASSIVPNGDGTETYTRFFDDPRWSNDGMDEFCSVKATRYVHHPAISPNPEFPMGRPEFYSDIQRVIYRLNISAGNLEGTVPGVDLPLSVEDVDDVHPIISAAVEHVEPLREHHWSPEADSLTFVSDGSPLETAADLYVADVSDVITTGVPVDVGDAIMIYHNPSNFDVSRPHWTPHGNTLAERIVFDCGNSIYTVYGDGTHLVSVTTAGWGAFWSPDGRYLAYRVPVYLKGRTRLYDIARFPLLGGAVVTLISDSSDKVVQGWCE